MGLTLELKLTHSAPDTWHTVSYSKCAKCPALRSLLRKTCKFRLSRNSTKFDMVTRFRETIPTVKSVSSSEIYKNFGFFIEITILPFFRKSGFSWGFTMSFENVYLFKSHAWIKYMFCRENRFKNISW